MRDWRWWLLSDRDQLARYQAEARKAAEERYCWEKEESKLLGAVELALKSPE